MLRSVMNNEKMALLLKRESEKILKKAAGMPLPEFSGLDERRPLSLDFSSQTTGELMQELSDRLCALNELIDNRKLSFSSHRRGAGVLITLYKKVLHLILRPYTNSVLERQRSFNEAVVQFLLGSWHLHKKESNEAIPLSPEKESGPK